MCFLLLAWPKCRIYIGHLGLLLTVRRIKETYALYQNKPN